MAFKMKSKFYNVAYRVLLLDFSYSALVSDPLQLFGNFKLIWQNENAL